MCVYICMYKVGIYIYMYVYDKKEKVGKIRNFHTKNNSFYHISIKNNQKKEISIEIKSQSNVLSNRKI